MQLLEQRMSEVGSVGAGGGAQEKGALGGGFCGEEDGRDVRIEGERFAPAGIRSTSAAQAGE